MMIKLYDLLVESNLRLTIPSDIKKIHKLFKKNNYKLYVVGGAVRDAILGKSPKDYDLATDAKPDEVLDIAKQGGFKTLEVGKSFGVVIVGGHEIATFRKDIGKGRRPSSVDYTDIKGDVERRDLTINALFYDMDKSEIVDLVGGIKDLKSKTIRTVGEAQERFDEDPLRKLRALRFAGSVGGVMDRDAGNAIKNDPSLKGVSAERIRDEFIKGIQKAKNTKKYLELSNNLRILPLILPVFNINLKFIKTNDYIVQLANLLRHENYQKIIDGLKKLKYTIQEVRDISFLVKLINFKPNDIYSMKVEQKNTKLTKKQISEWNKLIPIDVMKIWNFKLSIKGGDLVKQGFKGKDIQDKMIELEMQRYIK
jgi:tRNA nucleotidyltransferase/poly(A) polymerase